MLRECIQACFQECIELQECIRECIQECIHGFIQECIQECIHEWIHESAFGKTFIGAFRSALRSADSDKSDSDGFEGFLSWVCIMGSYRGFVSLLLGFLAGVILIRGCFFIRGQDYLYTHY